MRIAELLWDDWNLDHIGAKGIYPSDVEDVVTGTQDGPLFELSREGTVAVWGRTEAGAYLLVILAPRGSQIYYPVTARPMDGQEKRRYLKWLKK